MFLIIISGLFAVTSLSVCTAWFHNTVTSASSHTGLGIIIIIIIIIISNIPGKHEIKELRKNSHIGHCTHTSESTNVKEQNVFHVQNNITCSTNCEYRTLLLIIIIYHTTIKNLFLLWWSDSLVWKHPSYWDGQHSLCHKKMNKAPWFCNFCGDIWKLTQMLTVGWVFILNLIMCFMNSVFILYPSHCFGMSRCPIWCIYKTTRSCSNDRIIILVNLCQICKSKAVGHCGDWVENLCALQAIRLCYMLCIKHCFLPMTF